MMTVRFPNGFSVQYNTANYVIHGENHNVLRTVKDGDFVAVVGKDCIVEAVTPCRTYNAAQDITQRKLDNIEKELRSIKRKLGKAAR